MDGGRQDGCVGKTLLWELSWVSCIAKSDIPIISPKQRRTEVEMRSESNSEAAVSESVVKVMESA